MLVLLLEKWRTYKYYLAGEKNHIYTLFQQKIEKENFKEPFSTTTTHIFLFEKAAMKRKE